MSLPRPEDASRQQIQHVLGAFWSEWPGEDIPTVYTGTQVSATASFIKRFALCDSFYSSKLAYTEEDDIELPCSLPRPRKHSGGCDARVHADSQLRAERNTSWARSWKFCRLARTFLEPSS